MKAWNPRPCEEEAGNICLEVNKKKRKKSARQGLGRHLIGHINGPLEIIEM